MNLGDNISFYLNQMNLLNIIVRKDGDLRMTRIQLEHLFAEKEKVESLLKVVAAERDRVRG